MGADIEIETRDGRVVYFRDSYNKSNLAWIAGLSYWGYRGSYTAFLKKCSRITDAQIGAYTQELFNSQDKFPDFVPEDTSADWVRMFKKKRNVLKRLFAHDDVKRVVMWSV